jgi:hypothetical protein|tara:strand:+ start:710 stop:979 length:270 start_codon:yes stop_codon:yes gene_type:complete
LLIHTVLTLFFTLKAADWVSKKTRVPKPTPRFFPFCSTPNRRGRSDSSRFPFCESGWGISLALVVADEATRTETTALADPQVTSPVAQR